MPIPPPPTSRMMIPSHLGNSHFPMQMGYSPYGQSQMHGGMNHPFSMLPTMHMPQMNQMPNMIPQMSYNYGMENSLMYYYMMINQFPNMGCQFRPVIDLEAENP